MPGYKLSKLAEVDLEGIADYSVDKWGPEQAIRYILELMGCCEHIAMNPLLGRACDGVRLGYRRIEQGRHVLFYRQAGEEVLVHRILHQSMLPSRHTMEDPKQG